MCVREAGRIVPTWVDSSGFEAARNSLLDGSGFRRHVLAENLEHFGLS
jgi:hypothetical protein